MQFTLSREGGREGRRIQELHREGLTAKVMVGVKLVGDVKLGCGRLLHEVSGQQFTTCVCLPRTKNTVSQSIHGMQRILDFSQSLDSCSWHW